MTTAPLPRSRWPIALLCAAAALLFSCSLIAARPTPPSTPPATTSPTLRIALLAGDSVLVIASWGRGCDGLGCPDTWRSRWRAGTAPDVVRTRTVPHDSLRLAWPTFGDSTLVRLAVESVRRGIPSGWSPDAGLVLTRSDAAPPVPDSVLMRRADSLALVDSFPDFALRPALRWQYGTTMAGVLAAAPFHADDTHTALHDAGYQGVTCGLARNRYTGEVRILLPAGGTPEDDARRRSECAAAAASYAAERDA